MPDLRTKLDEVIKANFRQRMTGKLADWNTFQEKHLSFKTAVIEFKRNPGWERPTCWDHAIGVLTDVENQMKEMKQRWERVDKERRERERSRRDNRPPAIFEGGRADGNGG